MTDCFGFWTFCESAPSPCHVPPTCRMWGTLQFGRQSLVLAVDRTRGVAAPVNAVYTWVSSIALAPINPTSSVSNRLPYYHFCTAGSTPVYLLLAPLPHLNLSHALICCLLNPTCCLPYLLLVSSHVPLLPCLLLSMVLDLAFADSLLQTSSLSPICLHLPYLNL